METLAYLQAVQDENSEQTLTLEHFKLSGRLTGVVLGAAGAAVAVGVAQAPAQAYGYGHDYGCFERCEPVFLGGGYQVTSYKTYDVSFKGGYDKGCYSDCGYGGYGGYDYSPVSYGCYDHCGISYPSSGGCYDDCGYGGYGGYGGGYDVGYDYGHGGGCYDYCGVSYPKHDSCYDYCDVSYGYSTYDIQSALSYAGFHVAVDGVFGPETYHAVVAFQLAVGLAPDGIVGPATASALGLY